MTKEDRRHTSTILTVLRNRLVELCNENCRDDLADAVFLLDGLARSNSSAMRAQRDRMISIIANDDDLLETAAHLGLIYQAAAERERESVLH